MYKERKRPSCTTYNLFIIYNNVPMLRKMYHIVFYLIGRLSHCVLKKTARDRAARVGEGGGYGSIS